MARPKTVIDMETLKKAKVELDRIKGGKLAIQLKAIIVSRDNPVRLVGKILRVSRSSIFRWVNKFKDGGIEKLRDKPKGHMKSKLNDSHKQQIEEWIISGKNSAGKGVHWTLKKLQLEIYSEFGIHISINPLWKQLRKMDLVLKKPRPQHYKANKEQQDAFKKN